MNKMDKRSLDLCEQHFKLGNKEAANRILFSIFRSALSVKTIEACEKLHNKYNNGF